MSVRSDSQAKLRDPRRRVAEIVVRVLIMLTATSLSVFALNNLYLSAIGPDKTIDAFSENGSVSPTLVKTSIRMGTLAILHSDLEARSVLDAGRSALSGMVNGTLAENILRSRYAQELGIRTLLRAPLNSSVWLLLAMLQARNDLDDHRIAPNLLMSYYTSPAISELTPIRMKLAVSSGALGTPELRELVRADIIALLLQRPDMSKAITTAYRTASQEGKLFLERTVGEIQPSFLRTMR